MKLCSRAVSIRDDFVKATDGFVQQMESAAAEGDQPRVEAMHAQAAGSRRAMAARLNHHFKYCKECG